ncbi:DUF7289 family protein [Methanolobus profundi]|uniref:Flagellin N-terminal-like domain-containing protein n=1 Tax=Methanolobus profundi TaxID=487685 RepID=A0A1I4PG86_9EURY|nr:hypothetical protein [Methanolobus profundi]SFM26822.1 hypothetical protein SAMN04488696_0639 [Methanolobus profundi]
MNRPFYLSCEAVSTVIAAMLILVVLTTFISAINAYYIPSLGAENEIEHMQDVRDSFVEIASLAASGSSNEKVEIPLGSKEMPFGPSVSSSGTLTVDPNSSWINISMNAVAEPENRFDSVYILQDLTSISSFYLVKDAGLPATYDIIFDQDNMLHAEWIGDSTLLIETRRNGNTFFYGFVPTPLVDTDEYFTFDVLNPVYGFSDILEDVEKPFTLMLDGSFQIEYEKIPPYDNSEKRFTHDRSINISTGSFSYGPSNNFWIDQDFIFENGAVILQQSTSNRSLVRSRPFITVDNDTRLLNIQVFNVVGIADSMGGNGISTVNIQVEDHEEKTYPSVEVTNLTICSDYPSAWYSYLSTQGDVEMLEDGLVRASFYNMSVKMSSSDVMITIP